MIEKLTVDISKKSSDKRFLVKNFIKQAEEKTGLSIEPIENKEALARVEQRGLFSLYRDIFSEKPYYERFSIGETRDYFMTLMGANGTIYVAAQNKKGKPPYLIAFVASQPLSTKDTVSKVVAPYVDVSRSSYFAEDAVIPERRRQGISRSLKTLLMMNDTALGYNTMVLRTSVDSFQQAAAVQQLGGRQINGLYQDVDSLRLDGRIKPDRRAFYIFDLLAPLKYEVK